VCGFRLVVSLFVVAAFCLSGCDNKTAQPTRGIQENQSKPSALDTSGETRSGEALFKQYCSSCHPNGGNVSDPERTLFASALKRNHITSADDIIRIVRRPISRMIRFDESTLSDKDARIIAEYVLTSFK
jgi:cytochrome c6